MAAGVTAWRETVSATSPRDCAELTFEGLLGKGRLTVAALPDELVAETLPAFLGGDFGVVVGDFAGEGFAPADLGDFAREAGAAFAFLGRVEGGLGCAAA